MLKFRQKKNENLRRLVLKNMIHHHSEVCKETNSRYWKKNFPKEFINETELNVNGYPTYRRRSPADGGERKVSVNKNSMTEVNNSLVVPYNPYLIQKYDCHINVEICSSVMVVQYLFKYVYKGPDYLNFRIENETKVNKKIKKKLLVQLKHVSRYLISS
jgi:hypothetical protein